ncbi:hypothetical protein L0222_05795 [bacterium]|nr:hypothetical protein [bacterium]
MKNLTGSLLSLTVLCFLCAVVIAGEEQSTSEGTSTQVTAEDVANAVTAAVQAQFKADGMFHAKDNVLNKTWDLSMEKVHKDKLHVLENGDYFACVDFKAKDGAMLDVDFFLKNKDGKLVVTDSSIHKVDGTARYTYQEKGGVYLRVEKTKSESE